MLTQTHDPFSAACGFVARFVGAEGMRVWLDLVIREKSGHSSFGIYGLADRCNVTTKDADKVLRHLARNRVIELVPSSGSKRVYKMNAGREGVSRELRKYHG